MEKVLFEQNLDGEGRGRAVQTSGACAGQER